MSERQAGTTGESFFGRFHRLKTEARRQEPTPSTEEMADTTGTIAEAPEPPPPPTDEDMPPLDSLAFDSDYTGFLSPRVSDTLRKAALRKLFHASEFNLVDGLDEYAEDYTRFEALGDIITADMRHRMEVEAEKLKQKLLEEGAPDEDQPATDNEPLEAQTRTDSDIAAAREREAQALADPEDAAEEEI